MPRLDENAAVGAAEPHILHGDGGKADHEARNSKCHVAQQDHDGGSDHRRIHALPLLFHSQFHIISPVPRKESLDAFLTGNIVHVDGSVDPVRDKEVIDCELQLKDLETVENRIAKVQKQAQTGGDKNAKKLFDLLVRYKSALEQGKSCRTVKPENADEEQLAKELFLLTNKPVMYVCNVDEASAKTGNEYVEKVREAVKDEDAEILVIAAKIESDIAELESYEERQMFLEEMGLEESGVVRLIQSAYSLLNLRTYFTAGADECRAWTINKGDKAPKAAGVIHTDFEKGFIRAEVIKYDDFVELKSEAACRAAGKLGIEGKEYVVQDGDIMHFLFNV